MSQSKLQLMSLPLEILDRIAQAYISDLGPRNNATSVLSTCTFFRDLFLPKLYSSIYIRSLDHLCGFISSPGAKIHCPRYTVDSIVINIPGVPGGGHGSSEVSKAEVKRSQRRLTFASVALFQCPNVERVSFEFYSIRHSQTKESKTRRREDANWFEHAIVNLRKLKSFKWVPPHTFTIKGLSIVVVDQVIGPLANGLLCSTQLEKLELCNAMLPSTGLKDLTAALHFIVRDRKDGRGLTLNLRSVTGLNPVLVCELVLSSPLIKVNIADGFIESIWGPRVDEQILEGEMRDSLESARKVNTLLKRDSPIISNDMETASELSIQDTVSKAMQNISITVLEDGVAGSRMQSA